MKRRLLDGMRRRSATMLIPLMVVALVAGCARNSATTAAVVQAALDSSVTSLDPAQASDASTFEVLAAVDEGLVRINQAGVAEPGIASSWQVNAAGTTYTFHLRSNARWSNGAPVTAEDFVYAWERAINPETGSPYASDFSLIGGTAPLLQPLPSASHTAAYKAALAQVPQELASVQIQAPNATTLVVHLTSSAPYWIDMTALPAYYPVDPTVVAKAGSRFGTKASLAVYDGPFMVSSWTPGGALTLVRNPDYWDASAVALQGITFHVVPSASTQVDMFKAGELSLLEVPSTYLKEFSSDPEFHQVPGSDAGIIVANTRAGNPTANADLDCAISAALNRREFVDQVLGGGSEPAPSIVPPGAQPSGGHYQVPPNDLQPVDGDVALAKSDLQAALQQLGLSQAPKLRLLVPAVASVEQQAQALIGMWQAVGIPVETVPLDPSALLGDASQGDFNLMLFGWNADYPDPTTFLDLFLPGNQFNFGDFSNSTYERLLNAAGTASGAARSEDLANAEGELLHTCAVIPLTWNLTSYVTVPSLHGVVADPFGTPFDFRWASFRTTGAAKG